MSNLKSTHGYGIATALIGACFMMGCGAAPADEATDNVVSSSEALMKPTLPSPTLAVPAGNRLAFHYDAVGVQIYGCTATVTATATVYGWVFQAPEATLYGKHDRVKGKHYVGPTWESTDGSTVVGTKLAAFTADPTAIPELLLQGVSHTGDGRMSDVTYIQRLDTVAGLAPTTGCDATTVGTTARVDYTATYFFYVAKNSKACDDYDS
jgi:hypothetical protein